jgi:HTH-type transcriptional regulator, global nitrogen regulator NrpRI
LNALKQSGRALCSASVTEYLASQGDDISERTVRLYLQELDRAGLTQNMGRRGRRITESGLAELSASQTLARVGFLSAKIDQMTYDMTLDPTLRTGSVVVNTTLVRPEQLASCLDKVCQVFEQGYAMGRLAGLLEPGERVGDVVVPEGMLGFCSVCSVTLNGVMLKHGIPTRSRFGGLLELRDGKAIRFTEIINYDGTTVDPLEIFVRSAMTDYVGAITTGTGCIGVSFREIPANSRELVVDLAKRLDAIGLGGFMQIGYSGQTLLGIPVSEGRVGAVVIGGLNPMAILEELGIRLSSTALSGFLDFSRLFPYEELKLHV